MKKIIYIAMFILTMGQVFSADLESCRSEVARHGNGEGKDVISLDCVSLFKQLAGPRLTFSRNDLEIVAVENVIILQDLKDPQKIKFFAGKSTLLNHVTSFVVDEKNSEIIVLEDKSKVLFFKLGRTGNIAPRRHLIAEQIKGSTDIVLNPLSNEIVLLKENDKEALVYSRLANSEGSQGHKHTDLIKKHKNVPANRDSVRIDPKSKQAYFIQ